MAPGRRIPDALIGLLIAVVLMSVVLVLGTRLGWFGDDPTFDTPAVENPAVDNPAVESSLEPGE